MSKAKKTEIVHKKKFAPTSYKQALFINSDSFMCVFGGAAGCLDASAEFLSSEGWKKISEYEDGDLVGQFDANTNKVSFVKPNDYIKIPCESFKRINYGQLDFILSDEHRVLYYNRKNPKEPKVITFKDFVEKHEKSKRGFEAKIRTTFNVDSKGIDLTDNEIRLSVAIQADAHNYYEKGNYSYTCVTVTKHRKMLRLKNLLDSLEIKYYFKESDNARYKSGKSYYFSFKTHLHVNKVFPKSFYQMSQKQLEVVVDEVGYWDGSITPDGNIKYCSVIKSNVDFIQFAYHSCGLNSNYRVDVREHRPTHNDCYCVDSSVGDYRGVGTGKEKKPVEIFKSTDGFKYCFNVDTSFFVVRQNGTVFITGNSGKTYTSLMRFLRYVHLPDFVGYVFRTNATDLKKQGGAFPTAVKMFTEYDSRVTYTQQPMVIKFPSGATISFTGMDDEAGRKAIQGIEISAAMVDEAANMLEEDIWWIVSRLRTNADMRPNIWLTANPDMSSCLFDWINDFYLYPRGTYVDGELVEGRPNPDRNGVERFYLRVGNDLKWGDTAEELYEQYHRMFPKNPQTGESTCLPKSFRFIGATCFDNPEMLKKNPEYVSSLASQPRVTMERLLLGNWLAREESSGYYKRDWLQELDPHKPEDMTYLSKVVSRVRAWDIAGTVPSEANPDPDFTSGTLIARTRDGEFIIEDVQHVRKRSGENLDFIIKIAQEDREKFGNNVRTILPLDPAESGKAIKIVRAKEFAMRGIPVKFEKVGTKKSKLDKFTPFSSAAENGVISYIKADWNDKFHRELENFDGVSRRFHDDMVDSTASAYNALATTKEYKKFNLSLIG